MIFEPRDRRHRWKRYVLYHLALRRGDRLERLYDKPEEGEHNLTFSLDAACMLGQLALLVGSDERKTRWDELLNVPVSKQHFWSSSGCESVKAED